MCKKCEEFWDKYKKAERDFQEAKEAYLIQCRHGCDDKKEDAPKEEEPTLTKEAKILYSHGFLESQNKENLFFKPVDDSENTTVFIDLRKGSPQAYGFKDKEPLSHEIVHKMTKAAVNEVRMLTAKSKGQLELELEPHK